jgi:maltodextrin utilization protein YvdJ
VQPVGESQKKQSAMIKIYLAAFVISRLGELDLDSIMFFFWLIYRLALSMMSFCKAAEMARPTTGIPRIVADGLEIDGRHATCIIHGHTIGFAVFLLCCSIRNWLTHITVLL